ncbi:MAG TPA: exonuclease domain-containing protein [Solirubrobacteraceae bacterium]|nr:exonuclease domain-containing protein [Solirubrobacteraceae bacterium]
MDLAAQPVASAEFLVLDTETNGLGGEACELTEVGAVLVGGGELHERWSSLVRPRAPLRRGIQRFTGITQAMVEGAPAPEEVLPEVQARLRGRVLVAHNAPFDRRVLRQAFERAGQPWPDPPVLCTAALARVLLPLQRERRLPVLADALGVEVRGVHRALVDAETCARVLCALFPRLCANAASVADAVALCGARRARAGGRGSGRARERRRTAPTHLELERRRAAVPELDFHALPRDPGVYLFRDAAGATLYVGKSTSIKSRARAHFAPGAPIAPGGDERADWRPHAAVVDYQATNSELGALVLENRLIKQLRPPGNVRLTRRDERLVYIRCRLDIAFPILEVAGEPAAGHAVSIGPVRGRRLAQELVEQLDSLFGLRHCGRRLPVRDHPSAYGQMGRCLSPCLGDLDPNLYRRRLDEALSLFVSGGDGAGRLLAHLEEQMRRAAAEQRFERATWLRRRAGRVRAILRGLGGVLEATHARPRLIVDSHPTAPRHDAFWLVGGRLVDWGAIAGAGELVARTAGALRHAGRAGEVGAHVPPQEIDEVRIVAAYLASHPATRVLDLSEAAGLPVRLHELAAELGLEGDPGGRLEGQLDDGGRDAVLADAHR